MSHFFAIFLGKNMTIWGHGMYIKGRRYENGQSTEKVDLIRTPKRLDMFGSQPHASETLFAESSTIFAKKSFWELNIWLREEYASNYYIFRHGWKICNLDKNLQISLSRNGVTSELKYRQNYFTWLLTPRNFRSKVSLLYMDIVISGTVRSLS